MKGDAIVQTQQLLAQSLMTLAQHIGDSTGYQLTPITVAQLPTPAKLGMIACVTDGNPSGGSVQWGDTGTGGGSEVLLVWYNGTHWTVIGK